MKITSSDLKKIIKESLKRLRLQEAPFAGVEPGVYIDNKHSWITPPPGTSNNDPKAIDKFYRTPNYEKKANWAYAGYSIPIYIVPMTGTYILDSLQYKTRIQIFSKEEFKKLVEKSDSTIDLEKVFANLDAGACYIVSSSNYLVRGGLPTPWMIFHAMFDNLFDLTNPDAKKSDYPSKIYPMYYFITKIYHLINEYYTKKYGKHNYDMLNEILKRLNLKNIDKRSSIEDAFAELMTQELATRSGLQINLLGDEDDKFWQQILTMVKSANLKKTMENFLRGQIVAVANTPGD